LAGKDLRTHALSPQPSKQVWVELFKQFLETGKAKRVGNIKPRADNPTGVNLTLLYLLLALNTDILPIGTTNAVFNSFVSQDLSNGEHFPHLHRSDYSAVKKKTDGICPTSASYLGETQHPSVLITNACASFGRKL
jgi:hypothetical protein